MNPAWSVIFLTTLLGAGQGLFLALYAIDVGAANGLLALPGPTFYVGGATLALALLVTGLFSSFFHLGRPERAWRSAAKWRTSWLAREVIVLPAFMGAVFAYGAAHQLQAGDRICLWVGAAGTVLCIALFVCTAMIYACLKFLQEWHTTLTPLNYFLLGSASGFTLASVLAALVAPHAVNQLAIAALVLGALAYLGRLAALRRNARLRPMSSLATAIGVKHPHIEQKAQGFMGGSFNTREFFHGRTRETVRAVRWALLVLVFPVPAVMLGVSGENAFLLGAAFALQYVGLLAERWYFFAEANHPQNLYYQAIS
ncbi:MAG: dimethyl sulfoxide reductase anchor subunit [Betaproteobacteria bacterium]|nr:dimethyl sulfoxide reductase anchor subunit [Betaproteobacteria bacterium]